MKKKILIPLLLLAAALIPAGNAVAAPTVTAWSAHGQIRSDDHDAWCLTYRGKTQTTRPSSVPIVNSQLFLSPCVKHDQNQDWFMYRIPNSGQVNIVAYPHLCIAKPNAISKALIMNCDEPGKYTSLITFVHFSSKGWLLRIVYKGTGLYLTAKVSHRPRTTSWASFLRQAKNRANQQFQLPKWEHFNPPVTG